MSLAHLSSYTVLNCLHMCGEQSSYKSEARFRKAATALVSLLPLQPAQYEAAYNQIGSVSFSC